MAKCICNQTEDNEHLYYCEYLNNVVPLEKYQAIFGRIIYAMKYVLIRFKENMDKKEESETDHAITDFEPPPSVLYELGNRCNIYI